MVWSRDQPDDRIASALINGVWAYSMERLRGMRGKHADMVMMRIADIISSIPSMLYVILITLAAGAGAGKHDPRTVCGGMD